MYDEPGSEGKSVGINPQTHQLRRNFIFNRNWLGQTSSGYSVDYDDVRQATPFCYHQLTQYVLVLAQGSSQYNATENFLVYGAFKVRDGINRNHEHNLIYGKPADYQCDGFNSTTMAYNTIIDHSITYGCVGQPFGTYGTYNSVNQHHNTYYTPNNTALPFKVCGKQDFAQLQAAGYEEGSTISSNITVNQIIDMARELLMG